MSIAFGQNIRCLWLYFGIIALILRCEFWIGAPIPLVECRRMNSKSPEGRRGESVEFRPRYRSE